MNHRRSPAPNSKKPVAPKSDRQRRKELDARRLAKRTRDEAERSAAARAAAIKGKLLVNVEALRPTNSYDRPGFVQRGFYVDEPFTCVDCGVKGVWTAAQQKWWYEIAKGDVWTTARRCLPCRRRLRERTKAKQAFDLARRAERAARPRLPKSSRKNSRR